MWAESQHVQVALSSPAVCLPHLLLGLFHLPLCFSKGQWGWEDKGIRILATEELLFVFLIEQNTLKFPSWHQPIDSKHSFEIRPFWFCVLWISEVPGKPAAFIFFNLLRCEHNNNNNNKTYTAIHWVHCWVFIEYLLCVWLYARSSEASYPSTPEGRRVYHLFRHAIYLISHYMSTLGRE
jgi:hypothetical protein